MKTEEQIQAQWKAALKHKKEWQQIFIDKYAFEDFELSAQTLSK